MSKRIGVGNAIWPGRGGFDYRAAIAFDIRLHGNHGAAKVRPLLMANWEIYDHAGCARSSVGRAGHWSLAMRLPLVGGCAARVIPRCRSRRFSSKPSESHGRGDADTAAWRSYQRQVSERSAVRMGVPLPLGTHEYGRGVNFAFFSRHGSRVRLEFFDLPGDATPARVIDLDPARNRTGDVWHVWVEGIGPGQLYAYRVDGPYQPREHRLIFTSFSWTPLRRRSRGCHNWDFGPARGYDPSAPDRDLVCVFGRRCRSDAEMRVYSRAL